MRAVARMSARAVRAMTQACNILTNSGTPLNDAGGRKAAVANWHPVTVGAWSNATTYSFGETADGIDGKVYHSLSNGNLDNEPSASPSFWSLGFPCLVNEDRRNPVSSQEAGVQQDISRYRCFLPLGTPVTTKNRIALLKGPVYEIVGVNTSNANAVQIILDCRLVS